MSLPPLNIDEILQMAEKIETNGAAFYRRAAEHMQEPDAVRLLTGLAEMEDGHEALFKKMRQQVAKDFAVQGYDPDNEAMLYLQALADGHIFKRDEKPEETFSGLETVEEVFEQAIEREKDAIVFFLGLKDVTPSEWGKQQLEAIIQEEKGHVSLLSRALSSYKENLPE